MYLRVVKELFKENLLIKNEFVVFGEKICLNKITCPLVLVTGTKDHITPAPQLNAINKVVKSNSILQISVPAGHIGTFMGKKSSPIY